VHAIGMDDMTQNGATDHAAGWLARSMLSQLIEVLRERGYAPWGPRVQGGAVVLASIDDATDLPVGWIDHQSPGRYTLEQRDSDRVFDVVHGADGIKRHVFAPRETLLQIERTGERGDFEASVSLSPAPRLALLGVRACDLAALRIQDRIFQADRYPDPHYAARRAGLFLVGVSCTRSVSTCFCTSMGTGPAVGSDCDLALCELDRGFVVRAGSAAGREILDALALRDATRDELDEEARALDQCAKGIERRLEASATPGWLYAHLDHPRWDDVAARCLSCGNCTLVCPTCFCHSERDEPELDGRASLRVREWDSCFDRDHAQVHGKNFRPTVRERYRQWLTHKLDGWLTQFDTSGCVGCGRCISWCPVGIDLVEEVAAITSPPGATK
jgi:ferredoxin